MGEKPRGEGTGRRRLARPPTPLSHHTLLTCFSRFCRALTSFFWRVANCLEEAQGVRPETSASAGAAAPNTRAADRTVAAAADAKPFFLAGTAATAGRAVAALVVVAGALACERVRG